MVASTNVPRQSLTAGTIPSVDSFVESSEPPFILDASVQVLVDPEFKDSGSPTLFSFAQTFQADLASLTGFQDLPPVTAGLPTDTSKSIFLSAGSTTTHNYFSGLKTGEGYDFQITSRTYAIKGVEAIGSWWGTRTLLQQVALFKASGSTGSISLPAGSGSDGPGWEVRGFMLDAGRHWFQPSFLAELCIYASFFKLQTMHVHASDNLWNPDFLYGKDWQKLYSAFRFQPAEGSPISGLVPLKNESWTKDEFIELQTTCANHGVTLIPEIDTPGHSLAITKWKPEIMLAGQPDLLNLSYPETIPTVKLIWDEVLPWFTSGEVSIGADEYDSSLADAYISFVNEMAEYISTKSGKSIRVWGTNEPSQTQSISRNVTIQHWDFPGDSIPVKLVSQGYRVINSEQRFLYLDGKTSDGGQFPFELNPTLIWSGAPDGKGWAPNIFSSTDPANNLSPNEPLLRGSIMALWNDWGNNATTPLEIYYQLAKSLAMFSEKAWAGSDMRDSGLSQAEFEDIYLALNAAAPGQNLNRAVSSDNGVVFHYDALTSPTRTEFESVGPPYTFTFTVKPSGATGITVPTFGGISIMAPTKDGVLFSGRDSRLHLDSLTFEDPATNKFYLLGVTLPANSYTTVSIHATTRYTYAIINGTQHWWTTYLDIWGEEMVYANMSFAAPSEWLAVDSFLGELSNVSLLLG